MRSSFDAFRIIFLVSIAVLAGTLFYLVSHLQEQTEELSSAQGDNMQWGILQLDTEFANLDSQLTRNAYEPFLTDDQVRLRIDIALSRLAIVRSGRSAALYEGDAEFIRLQGRLDQYAATVIEIIDAGGALSQDQHALLVKLTHGARPDVRALSLLTIQRLVAAQEATRKDFLGILSLTGGVAISLLLLMGGLLVVLNAMVIRARARDAALTVARDSAERADQAKSRFLAIMSHEMRTPLNAILGVLDMLKTTPLAARQAKYVDTAISSGEILLDQVNEAMDITRIETGLIQFNAETFTVTEIVENVMAMMQPLAQEKGLSLHHSINDSPSQWYRGDNTRIQQILTNLVGNAIKFTQDGLVDVKVAAHAQEHETMMAFAVTDTGIGIAPDNRERVFEDFVTLQASEGRQARGDGLGLAISRRIARAMGGDLVLEDADGMGARFVLTVPLTPIGAEDAPAIKSSANSVGPSLSVLVIEDNRQNRAVLRDMLESLGHVVTEAVDGLAGLAAAQRQFDCILMDINMPGLDGIATTQRIRQDAGPNWDTPIIGLTAHGREAFRDAATRAGMTALYAKPIRLQKLKDLLDQIALEQVLVGPVVRDLLRTLGKEKADKMYDEFFADIDARVETARCWVALPTDAAAAMHQHKGAAAMFGARAIEDIFEQAQDAANDGDHAALMTLIEQLPTQVQIFRAAFTRFAKDPGSA